MYYAHSFEEDCFIQLEIEEKLGWQTQIESLTMIDIFRTNISTHITFQMVSMTDNSIEEDS